MFKCISNMHDVNIEIDKLHSEKFKLWAKMFKTSGTNGCDGFDTLADCSLSSSESTYCFNVSSESRYIRKACRSFVNFL